MLSELQLIVIDEMSLLKADMLYCIHMRLCEVFQSKDLFANKSIILVGDLLQLPPVKGKFVFEKPVTLKFSVFFDVNSLWHSFEFQELVQNHRQGDGNRWANILNELRVGNVSEEAEQLLKTRLTTEEFLEQDAMHVFYTNKEVSGHNTKMLQSLPESEVILNAIKCQPRGYKCQTTKHGTIDNTQFMDALHLKIGARICLTFNINTVDELVNGALGTIIAFERNKFGKIEAIIIAFDQESTGAQQRASYPALSKKYEDQNGTPIFRQELEYQITSRSGKSHAPRAKIIQFPLKLSWANTAHKMQGTTVKKGSKLVVHWNKKFKPGMAYVMLGRCESLDDIFIAGDFDKDLIKCSPEALKEAKRISEVIQERNDSNKLMTSISLSIGCLNVRSLQAHFGDLENLEPLLKCDIFSLCETWLPVGITYTFVGFTGTFVNAGRGKGLAVFTRFKNTTTKTHLAETFSAVLLKALNMNFIFLYLSKDIVTHVSVVWPQVKELLDKWIKPKKTIIMGDVNWNFIDSHPMKKYCEKKHFSQLVEEATHDGGNIIDHAYTNVNSMAKISVHSVTFSDHDLVCLSLPKDQINMNY